MDKRWSRRALIGGALAGTGAAATVGIFASRDGAALVAGRSRARPVAGSRTIPRETDVVVVGGGNIGVMTALTLAERDIRVVLCEKGVVAGESSGRSMGFIDSVGADPIKIPILARSKVLWAGMNARVGADTGYRPSGLLLVSGQAGAIAPLADWLDVVRGMPGVDGRMLSAAQVRALLPEWHAPAAAGFHSTTDASAEAQLFAPAAAVALRRSGGLLFQNCAVRGVETKGGRVAGVVTERGAIACSSVVIAGGLWSPLLARSLGIDIPQFMGFSSCVRVASTGRPGPQSCVVSLDSGFILRPTLDGGYDTAVALGTAPLLPSTIRHATKLWPLYQHQSSQIRGAIDLDTFLWEWNIPERWNLSVPSPFEQRRIFTPEVRAEIADEAAAMTAAALPGSGKVIERWAGALTNTPDNAPILSQVNGRPGLYIGSGFNYGLTMAPAAGEALADLVTGATPRFDVSPFRLGRFSEGSPILFRS